MGLGSSGRAVQLRPSGRPAVEADYPGVAEPARRLKVGERLGPLPLTPTQLRVSLGEEEPGSTGGSHLPRTAWRVVWSSLDVVLSSSVSTLAPMEVDPTYCAAEFHSFRVTARGYLQPLAARGAAAILPITLDSASKLKPQCPKEIQRRNVNSQPISVAVSVVW
jgi:hypothetical protein